MAVSMAADSASPSSGISSQATRSSWPKARMRCTPARPSSVGSGYSQPSQVAPAVQVEAVQAEGTAEDGQPGGQRLASAARLTRATGRPACALPAPSGRCISTTSSQRPNFQPTERSKPQGSKPSARCTPIEPRLALSPITASICRAPAAWQRASNSASSRRPDAAALGLGVQVDRVLDAEAVGRARPEVVGIGIAQHPAVLLGHQPGQALGQHVVAAPRHLGSGRALPVRRCRCPG